MGRRQGRVSEKGLYGIEDDAEASPPGQGVREVPGTSSITREGRSSGPSVAWGRGADWGGRASAHPAGSGQGVHGHLQKLLAETVVRPAMLLSHKTVAMVSQRPILTR